MITKEQAYDMVDRFLRNNMDDEAYAEYSDALDTIYRVQQPDSTSVQVPDNVREFVDSWASETCGLKEFDAGVAFACREIKAMLNQSQEG